MFSLAKDMQNYMRNFLEDDWNHAAHDTAHPADIVPVILAGNNETSRVSLHALETWYRVYQAKRQSATLFKPASDFVRGSLNRLQS